MIFCNSYRAVSSDGSSGLLKRGIHQEIAGAMTAYSMVRVRSSVEISLSVMHLTWSTSMQIKICFSPDREYCISIVPGKDVAHLARRGCQYGPEWYERLMKLRQPMQKECYSLILFDAPPNINCSICAPIQNGSDCESDDNVTYIYWIIF